MSGTDTVEEVSLPQAVAPNVSMQVAPNGLLRVAVGVDLIWSSFYCDATAARVIGQHFMDGADALDRAWAAYRDLTLGEATDGADADAGVIDAAERFAVEVDDALAVLESPEAFD